MITARLTDDKKGIAAAADILKADGVVAIPTETVYGLAASAFSDKAIEKVFIAKGRPQDNPLIVHISDIGMISSAVSEFGPIAKTLADAFWPGPLTLVLKKSERIAESVSRGLDTVAVRMPSHKVAREVIKAAGIPLAAPSANISGSPSPTTADHVIADLDGRIDAVIMSGSSEVGVESTVVSLVTDPPRLLRPGRVTAEELMEYIPNLVIDKAVLSEPEKGEKVASPGMKYKHYSPKTEVLLISGSEEAFADFVNKQENCLAICFTEDEKSLTCDYLSYGAKTDGEAQAKSIFSLLRKADTLGKDKIYIHAPEKTGVSLAVYNRLIRAAAFRVIEL